MIEIPAIAIVGYVYFSILVFYLVAERWLKIQRIETGVLIDGLLMGRKALGARRRAKRNRALGFEYAI